MIERHIKRFLGDRLCVRHLKYNRDAEDWHADYKALVKSKVVLFIYSSASGAAQDWELKNVKDDARLFINCFFQGNQSFSINVLRRGQQIQHVSTGSNDIDQGWEQFVDAIVRIIDENHAYE